MYSHEKHKKAQKAGAAIVELALAMLLMMSMIVFSVFVCRALSQRNRALAASRTAAWLYTHADKPKGADSVETPAFKTTLSQWHFGAKDPTSVSLTMDGGSGLIAKSEANKILNVVSSELESQKSSASVGALDSTSIPEVTSESPASFVGDCFSTFVAGAVNWLTDDFKFYRAEVQVSTPLIFGPEAYQLFGWLSGEPSTTKSVTMSPTFIGSCTMPMQNGGEGIGDPFGDLIDRMQDVTGWLQALLDESQDNAVYRPYDMGQDPAEIDEQALYALLAFEIYDENHVSLKDGSSATWAGGTATFNNETAMNALLDACGGERE